VVVLSPRAYNGRAGLALLCPITSRVKGYPFEVPLPPGLPLSGVVLADQVKCLDWRARLAEHAGTLPPETVADVLRRLGLLLT
jgi:mRNA interferase MazF